MNILKWDKNISGDDRYNPCFYFNPTLEFLELCRINDNFMEIYIEGTKLYDGKHHCTFDMKELSKCIKDFNITRVVCGSLTNCIFKGVPSSLGKFSLTEGVQNNEPKVQIVKINQEEKNNFLNFSNNQLGIVLVLLILILLNL